MAKATVKMPEDFLMKISKLGNQTDEIIPKVLKAGAEVVEDKVRSNLQSIIGKGTKEQSRSTGELLSSLGTTQARQDKNGEFNVKIGFKEPRSDDRSPAGSNSNAKLAAILEYGKHGQPPKPFLAPAKSASKKACVKAMTDKLEEELKRL